MKRTNRRIFGLFAALMLVLCFGMLATPATAQAAEPTAAEALANALGTEKVTVDGNTVKLLDDITLTATVNITAGEPVVLDLNGHEISKSKASVITVLKDAELTITDFSSGKPGSIVSGTGTLCGTVTMSGTGKLTLEKGTIRCTGSGTTAYVVYGAATSTFIMNGGTIVGTMSSGLYNNTNGNTQINGGAIEGSITSISDKYLSLASAGKSIILTGGDGSVSGSTITSGTISRMEVTDSAPAEYIAYRDVSGATTYLASGDLSLLLNNLNGTNTATIHVVKNAEIYKSFNAISALRADNTLTFDIASGITVSGTLSFDGPALIEWTGGGNFTADVEARNSTYKGYTVDKSESGRIALRLENAVCRIGEIYYGSLANAVKAVGNSGTTTIVMVADEVLTESIEISGSKKIELDLNGCNISYPTGSGVSGDAMTIYGSNTEVTITGKGTISSAGDVTIRVGASAPKVKVMMDSDVTVKGGTGILVQPLSSNSDSASATAEVVVKGKLINDVPGGSCINVQGQLVNGKAIITIEDGAEIRATGDGIYAAGSCNITVNGGTIEGPTGIEIRAGKLTVNAGEITATADSFSVEANGSGGTTVGAGIAVAQHNTELPIEVIIKGGTISGYVGLNIADPQGNGQADKIDISVKGGDFIATGSGSDSVSVHVEDNYDVTGFVEGGNFSDSLLETGYLDPALEAELFSVKKNEDAPYSYYPSMTEALAEAQDGDTVTQVKSMESDVTTVPITFNAGYDEISIVVYVEPATTYTMPKNDYFKHPKGWEFIGWMKDGVIYASGDVIDLPADGMTLVAQWGEVVDKTLLEAAVAEAEELNAADYTADSWAALEAALAHGKTVLADENATQEAVDAATAAIKAAIAALESTAVDKSALLAAISEAAALEENAYTAESWKAMLNVLATAQAVAADENATQEMVDAATAALKAAMVALVKVEAPTPTLTPTATPTPTATTEPPVNIPQTGDSAMPMAWLLLMGLSLGGLFLVVNGRKKGNR